MKRRSSDAEREKQRRLAEERGKATFFLLYLLYVICVL